MNIHYKNYPTDYTDSLKSSGKRHKARCFWEYYDDVQNRDVNSIGFYAKSWGMEKPMSKGTVHKWVREFRDEIQKFYDAHILVNQQHYSSVKKQSERQVNGKRTNELKQTPSTQSVDETEETASERQVNKALNIDINHSAHTREERLKSRMFDSFFFIYRQFNKYAGRKADALESYMRVEDVSYKSLDVAAILYLGDHTVERKVGAKRFIDDKVYLNYLDLRIEVMINGDWVPGVYDADIEVFRTDLDAEYRLTAKRFAEKLQDGEVKFVRSAA